VGVDYRRILGDRGDERILVVLLQEFLDDLGVSLLSLVGILSGTATGPSLAQQIPTAVKLDRDPLQALPIGRERFVLRRIGLLSTQQCVLLLDQQLDTTEDRFIVHERTIPDR
jgi:hypothetical protein